MTATFKTTKQVTWWPWARLNWRKMRASIFSFANCSAKNQQKITKNYQQNLFWLILVSLLTGWSWKNLKASRTLRTLIKYHFPFEKRALFKHVRLILAAKNCWKPKSTGVQRRFCLLYYDEHSTAGQKITHTRARKFNNKISDLGWILFFGCCRQFLAKT